jgi:DNA replication and repair protein RecF
MVIEEFSALGFRNLEELRIGFSSGINVIHGANGQGKTNLVEGLYFLNHLDSFRTHNLGALIAQGAPQGFIQGIVSTDDIRRKARVELTRRGRRVWVDEQPVPKLSAYVSSFFALVFNPDSLYLFRHVPAERRWLVNRVLSFWDPRYLAALRELRVVHAQKNQLLKRGETSSLPAWNQLLADKSHAIVTERAAFAGRVNSLLAETFSRLTGRDEALRLEYEPSLAGEPAEMVQALERAREQELRAGHALLGPHRDGLRLALGQRGDSPGRPDTLFSQGEYRAALLAFQMALGRLLEDGRGFRPVLILDDAFSELDDAIRARLYDGLARLANQMFITTTETLQPLHAAGARIMEIRAGRIAAVRN